MSGRLNFPKYRCNQVSRREFDSNDSDPFEMEYGPYGGESGGGSGPEWPEKEVYEHKEVPELCHKQWSLLSNITKSDLKINYTGSGKADKLGGHDDDYQASKHKVPEERTQEDEQITEKLYEEPLDQCGVNILPKSEGLSSGSRASVNQGIAQQASEVVTGQYSGTPNRGLSSSPDSDNSSDSDWLSVSDSSDDYAQKLDLTSLSVLADIVDKILGSYTSWKQHGPQNAITPNQTHIGHQGDSIQKQGSSRKRLHADESLNDGSSPRLIPAKKQKSLGEAKKYLTCPYWKKSPQQYIKCFRYVKDVRQHVYKCHRPAWRCLRCGDTFPSGGERDSHARADPACEVRHILHDDISLTQLRSLTRRPNPRLTMEEQWYAIWDIVFPGVERPCSPYIDSALSKELSLFQEFYYSRGLLTLHKVLKEETMEPFRQEDQQGLLDAVFSTGLDKLMDEWLFTHSDHGGPSIGGAYQSITPFSLPLLTIAQPAPVSSQNIAGNTTTLETAGDSTLRSSPELQDMHSNSEHFYGLAA